MTAVHRPLSAWVSRLEDETLTPVNDGDDRVDARTIEYFSTGWDRTAVQWGYDQVLSLTADDGTVVVELDDYGRPIPVTGSLLDLVREIEQDWPSVDPTLLDNVIWRLPKAALSLRYWLLERLAGEGDPPDDLFAVLPWYLLDRAVASVLTTLGTPDQPGELVEIRHWLTPAVRGLTGPLEQLDHGLRTGDGMIARLGAEGLLDNLRHIPLSRIPARSVTGLVPLVARLGEIDPLYRHASRVVRARLTEDERSVRNLRVTLNSALDAAANHEDVREHTEAIEDDAFRVRVDETQAGWVRVLVEVAKPREDGPFTHHAGVFVRVLVVPRDAPGGSGTGWPCTPRVTGWSVRSRSPCLMAGQRSTVTRHRLVSTSWLRSLRRSCCRRCMLVSRPAPAGGSTSPTTFLRTIPRVSRRSSSWRRCDRHRPRGAARRHRYHRVRPNLWRATGRRKPTLSGDRQGTRRGR